MGITLQPAGTSRGYAYGFCLAAGFVFWFILGFPFQHHNESYIWAVHLERGSFLDCVLYKMIPVANHRPFGQAAAWLTFRLSDGSVVPAQVFNFVVAMTAWLLAFMTIRERRVFGLAGLVVGGMLFSGYIYVFHLHGVFYSPVLLLLVFLILVFEEGGGRNYVALATVAAIVGAFFHPYALLLFIAAVLGAWWKGWRMFSRRQSVTLLSAVLVAAVAIFWLVILPGNSIPASLTTRWTGLLTSYRATEVHPAVSAVVALLTVATALSIDSQQRARVYLVAGALVALLALKLLSLPMIFAWIGVSAAKLLVLNRLSLGAMLLAATGLPAIAPTGSPTYAIYAAMLCAVALAVDARSFEQYLAGFGFTSNIIGFAIVVAAAIIIRSGVSVPILSNLATPLLAERERTEQLTSILDWWRNSRYAGVPIALTQKAPNPVDVKDVAERSSRPPTSPEYLALYIGHRWKITETSAGDAGRLVVVFGNEERTGAEPLLVVQGRFAGPARVLVETQQK